MLTILAFIAGLLVGWGFLPQPAWVGPWLNWAKEKFAELSKLWTSNPPPPPPPSSNTA